MSLELLARVQTVDQVEEALKGCELVLGFTAREGKERKPQPIQTLGPSLDRAKAPRAALLFGSEDSGLPSSMTQLCNRLFRIDLPGLPSLNLSHAVAIALHEAHSRRILESTQAQAGSKRKGHNRMSFEERDFLARRAFEVLSSTPFQMDEPHLQGSIHRLLHRGALQTRDGRMLHKVLTLVEWLREKSEGSPHWPHEGECG